MGEIVHTHIRQTPLKQPDITSTHCFNCCCAAVNSNLDAADGRSASYFLQDQTCHTVLHLQHNANYFLQTTSCKTWGKLTFRRLPLGPLLSACAWRSDPTGPRCMGQPLHPGHTQCWLPQGKHALPLHPRTSSNIHSIGDILQERRRRPAVCGQCLPATMGWKA